MKGKALAVTAVGWSVVALFGVFMLSQHISAVPASHNDAVIVPSPVSTIEYGLLMIGPYGAGSGEQGVGGLEFFSDARSPTQFTNDARTYIGNVISGTVMPTSLVSPSPPYTFTAGLTDYDLPDRFTLQTDCPVAFSQPYSDYLLVYGVITAVDCGQVQSGQGCRIHAHLSRVGGRVCP